MKRRNESGFFTPFEWLLVATAMAAVGVTFGTLINIATSEDYGGGGGGPRVAIPVAIAGLGTPPLNDCGRRVLDLFKDDMTYSADDGWQLTGISKPVPPPRPDESSPRYRAEIKEYNKEVLAYNTQATQWNTMARIRIADINKEMNQQECAREKPPITQPSPDRTEEATISILGNYAVSWTGVDCPFDPDWERATKLITIGGSGDQITFHFNRGGQAIPLTKVGDSYEVSNEKDELHIRFGRFGEQVQISGSYKNTITGVQCSGLFSGTKS